MTDAPLPLARTTADGPAAAPPPPLPAALLGSHFDLRFDLLGTIGAGSSGTVYRARLRDGYAELPAGSTVAVKFLRQDLAFDERARERLRSEGQLGLELRHPNVAAIFGIETFDLLGLPLTYLVMEYVAGTTLRTYLQQQGPPVEDLTRRIGADAAAGLQALHRRGMVHRDVKPENLVLTPAGQVKVVDLGLARPVGSKGSGSASSSAHGIAGSVAYTAPEALRGLPATPRSDLYALGVVLFEVATGRHPFAGKQTVDDMIDAHLRLPPPRPSHLRPRMSALLEQLILELLAKAPDQRPRDAAEVQRALQHGERAEWWRRHETQAPALASGRRLRRMRRQADAPFAGREAELAELDRLLAKARSGAGSVVCVQGPVGIGRRRLLDEAMARWLEAGSDLLVLGGEAEPMRGHGQPFADTLLDFLLRGDEAGSPNAVARAALAARTELQLGEADASALALAVTGRSQEAPEVHADRLASALLSLPRPRRLVVLRVDAADRLDTSARLALARLAAGAPGLQLLLLLTAGPDGLQLPGLVRIELQGLPEPAFLAFGRALFRGGEVGEALLHLAHGALSGSPGNLLEALDHLLQQEQLAGRPGDYHALAATAEVRPAPRHLERFRARVALLPLDQRNVLEAAAVLGERFPLADLAALVSQPELQILETLSLFRGRVIRAQGGDVAFRHRDFRQALLRAIPEAARTTLHHAAAALLQQRSASPLEIGMHLSMALDHEACIAPLLAGLQALVQRGSRRTSLRIAARLRVHFQALPRTPANERSRLSYLLLSARARANAQQTAAAAPLFEEALQLARQQDDHERSGDALTGLSACALDAGRLLAAVELLELAHAQLSPLQTESGNLLAARAHALHARILLYLGSAVAGQQQLQQALRRLPADAKDLHYHFLIDRARLEALRHHYGTALQTLQAVETAPAARHLPRVRMRLFLYRGQVRALLGDDAAVADLRAAADDAARLSLPTYAARAQLYLGERALRHGDREGARTWLEGARTLAASGGDQLAAAFIALALADLGVPDDGLEERVRALGMPSLRAAFECVRSDRLRKAGLDEDARAVAEAALAAAAGSDLPLSIHLRLLATAERRATARSLLQQIAERLPRRSMRRRLLAEWREATRI